MKKYLGIFFASLLIIIFCFSITSVRGYTKDNFYIDEMPSNVELISKQYEDAIVQLFVVRDGGTSFGSGFFVNNENIIATNYHVVHDAKSIVVSLKNDEYVYKASVIAVDKKNDIALIRVNGIEEYKTLDFTIGVDNNDEVYTCGYVDDYVITYGKVNDTNYKYDNNFYIDISNVVEHGNSGGPAINSEGLVIGIVTLGNSKSTSLVPSYKIINLMASANTKWACK